MMCAVLLIFPMRDYSLFVFIFVEARYSLMSYTRPPPFIWGRITAVRKSGCPILDMSCALKGTLNRLVCEVREGCPNLAVLRSEVDRIWCGS